MLKQIFAVPRPAAVFDNSTFVIIGKTLSGSNSSPSGHSITIFLTLTVLFFAFIPKKKKYKILWFFFIIITGIILAFSRVAVGAHYPLDVIFGGAIGYVSGLLGILISRKYKIWGWINDEKYYPVFMLLLQGCGIWIIIKILNENLIIFYFSLTALFISLYQITKLYVEK
ncbi:phosphatase PAP2 family protein [Flavobacterium sp. LAR06]|uniref:phosphatase PAP2 family protein n=1 Tax=Flavobacterium sp. LAR06 TaxID=3064897 RepID=UPI0035C1CB31